MKIKVIGNESVGKFKKVDGVNNIKQNIPDFRSLAKYLLRSVYLKF